MKAILIAIIVCLSVCDRTVAIAAVRAKAKSDSTAPTGERASVGNSWRYKFHQGRWWYWLSANRWAVYENGRWLTPPGESLKAVAETRSAPRVTPQVVDARGESPKAVAGPPSPGAKKVAHVQRSEGGSFAEDYPAAPVTTEPAVRSADYYLSTGNVFSRHAHEHAQVLERYAASQKTVPADVVREQAKAIHHDVEQAQKSFSQVAAAGKASTSDNLPNVVKQLQASLKKVTESVSRLEGQVRRQEKVQATLVRGQTVVINRLLQQASEAARAAEEERRKQERDQADRAGVD